MSTCNILTVLQRTGFALKLKSNCGREEKKSKGMFICTLLKQCLVIWCISGLNPTELRGSRTGVFVGCSASETGGVLTQDPETVTGYTLTGCVRSMFSNRLSFTFDLRGCELHHLRKTFSEKIPSALKCYLLLSCNFFKQLWIIQI
ncbi:unnamed protein product [Brugia timori]|uniref:Ketoacyl_synth_N domain-containing protein n=1 Tax=Brugia timori TaxID=42155 RepID=A0A0R3Q8B8_9BILA|nr:unnamed protein product [Brugia timori]